MTGVRFYRGRDLGKEVVFDFPSSAHSAPRDEIANYFVGILTNKEAGQSRGGYDEIEVTFLRDTLTKIRAGLPLVTVTYRK